VTPASFQNVAQGASYKAPKTLNEYLATLSAFWTWLRKQSRVSVNPFELVERTDTRGKERVQRRALSDAQVVLLLQAAGKNQLAYMLPLYAGLRRNEVKTLRWSNLVLGESGGLLRIHAAVNKNRKEQSLPLHRELAEMLQQQKPADSKTDNLVVVNGVPKMKEFRQDLAKAGIPFLDERGHRMDYHALRTTFITRLSTMKVHPRLAMELARHSDMRLTMKTYTDAGQLPLREVMDGLPGFGERADSRIDSRTLGPTGQSVSQPVIEKRELKSKKSLQTLAKVMVTHSLSPRVPKSQNGGERGIRTPVRLLTVNGLANRRLQPLGHLSTALNEACPPSSHKQIFIQLRFAGPNSGFKAGLSGKSFLAAGWIHSMTGVLKTPAYNQMVTGLKAAPKTWLVTGVAGFIGSNLLETLLKLDQRVTGLDNFSTGKKKNLEEVKAAVSPAQWARFQFIEDDIADAAACRALVREQIWCCTRPRSGRCRFRWRTRPAAIAEMSPGF